MERRLLVAMMIMGIVYITMFFIQENEIKELNNKISEQEKELKYKEEVILSQGQLLIENEYNNCYCGFYEDFYYEFADDVGAYE